MKYIQLDGTSWLMCAATVTGGFFNSISKSEVLFWLTVISGVTTVVYNFIRITQAFKKNKKPDQI